MSQVTTTQEIRRSHTTPTRVNTPIPVDTPSNPFSPTREQSSIAVGTQFHAQTMTQDVPPTFYPQAESSQMPQPSFGSILRDKGKEKASTPLYTPTPSPARPNPDLPGGPPSSPPSSPSPGPHGPRPALSPLVTPAPVNVPNGREKGIKPQPFTDKTDFQTWRISVILYLLQNDSTYPTHQDKIMFTLTLMTEGVPGQWMKLWIQKRLSGTLPYPSFDDFFEELRTQFQDPNLE